MHLVFIMFGVGLVVHEPIYILELDLITFIIINSILLYTHTHLHHLHQVLLLNEAVVLIVIGK